jgi:hypothetical protein
MAFNHAAGNRIDLFKIINRIDAAHELGLIEKGVSL